ncbi:MAG TPA: ABC transporter substrate-binding protein [Anaeromyxobacteraceae bacterium]|nr:ABC transporter substrate-binding protein [Anaeromyxobacteraceae bacterium]
MSPGPLLALLLAAVPPAAAGATPAPLAPAAPPGPAKDPVSTVRAAERQVRLAFQQGGKRTDLLQVGAAFVAWDELARRSLPGRWEKLPAADLAAFSNALRTLTEETWLSGLLRPDPLYAFAVFGSDVQGSDAEVRTRFQSGGTQAAVALRLFRGKDRLWRIVDLSRDGVSIQGGYAQELPGILDQKGIPGLLATLEARRQTLVRMRPGNP